MNGAVQLAEGHQPAALVLVLIARVLHLFIQIAYVAYQWYIQLRCDTLRGTQRKIAESRTDDGFVSAIDGGLCLACKRTVMPVGEQGPDGLDEPVERASAVHLYRLDGVGVREGKRFVLFGQ